MVSGQWAVGSGGAPPAGGETLSHRLRRRQPPNGAQALRGSRLRAGKPSVTAFGGASPLMGHKPCGGAACGRETSQSAFGCQLRPSLCRLRRHLSLPERVFPFQGCQGLVRLQAGCARTISCPLRGLSAAKLADGGFVRRLQARFSPVCKVSIKTPNPLSPENGEKG